MTYVYRVRVLSYPEGSDRSGWEPDNWEYNGYADPESGPIFSWPHQRQYFSRGNAERRAALFRKYGCEVEVEQAKVTWPSEIES